MAHSKLLKYGLDQMRHARLYLKMSYKYTYQLTKNAMSRFVTLLIIHIILRFYEKDFKRQANLSIFL